MEWFQWKMYVSLGVFLFSPPLSWLLTVGISFKVDSPALDWLPRQDITFLCASSIEEMEEPFETILQFRYANQRGESSAVWWRLPKEKRPRDFPAELGVAAANILLLYE